MIDLTFSLKIEDLEIKTLVCPKLKQISGRLVFFSKSIHNFIWIFCLKLEDWDYSKLLGVFDIYWFCRKFRIALPNFTPESTPLFSSVNMLIWFWGLKWRQSTMNSQNYKMLIFVIYPKFGLPTHLCRINFFFPSMHSRFGRHIFIDKTQY